MTDNKTKKLEEDNSLPLFAGHNKNNRDNLKSVPSPQPKGANISTNSTKKQVPIEVKFSSTKDSTTFSSLGPYLQEARVKAGYSISQVAITTKLNIHYIEALERDDYKHTPPYIYVKAYVKKLSSVYNIDEKKALSLLKPFGGADKAIPDALMQDLQETKQTNKADEEKIKLISKIITISSALVIILALLVGFFVWLGSDSTPSKPLTAIEKVETAKNMEQLIAPQSILLTRLPIEQQK